MRTFQSHARCARCQGQANPIKIYVCKLQFKIIIDIPKTLWYYRVSINEGMLIMNPKSNIKGGKDDNSISIGDVFLMKFDGRDSEQGGVRPGVVFQNNIGNEHSPNIIALPITSNLKKTTQPTHVVLRAEDYDGFKRDSMVLCENPQRMSKGKLIKPLTKLSQSALKDVAVGNALASSAIAYLSYDELIGVWEHAKRLNGIYS